MGGGGAILGRSGPWGCVRGVVARRWPWLFMAAPRAARSVAGMSNVRPAPQILFVPGAFTGEWTWNDVVQGLRAEGIESVVVELPTTGERGAGKDFEADVAALRGALDALVRPAIVCAHSYGGAVATAAVAAHEYVRELIYLAGAAPASGESMASTSAAAGEAAGTPTDGAGPAPREDGLLVFPPEVARQALFNDCDHDRAHEALAQLEPQSAAGWDTPIESAAWTQVPAVYVRATQDLVPRALGEGFLDACEEVIDLDAGHCPHWSQPAKVVELLVARVRAEEPQD
jgi:pimeloyl-ACP methyl ester carboxylesterase